MLVEIDVQAVLDGLPELDGGLRVLLLLYDCSATLFEETGRHAVAKGDIHLVMMKRCIDS